MQELLPELEFDLDKLTEFNPALIYSFEPELSYRTGAYELGNLLNVDGQINDMYQAYLYAQTEILPTIRNVGINNISPTQILEWLNQIHGRIAKQLAEENNTQAGEYTKAQVYRWHGSSLVSVFLGLYFEGKLPEGSSFEMLAEFYGMSPHELNVDVNQLEEFVQLMRKIKDTKSIKVSNDKKITINWKSQNLKFELLMHKLVSAYRTNQLTPTDRDLVNKIVKICMPPSDYKEAMEKFANDLLMMWQKCGPNNILDIARLASFAFFQITDIHAYFNGNGRVATCWINIIIRSFLLPSILIRQPNEKESPDSSYCQAIKHIDTEPGLLIQHIMSRILEAQKTEFKDDVLRETVTLRVASCSIVRKIIKEFPSFNINEFYKEQTRKIQQMNEKVMDVNEYYLTASRVFNEAVTRQFQELRNPPPPPKYSISAVLIRKYSVDEIKVIVEKLESLTGYYGWQTYNKSGLSIVLNFKDKNVANKLVDVFQCKASHALDAKFMMSANTGNFVVLLENIKIRLLLSISSLFETPKEKAENISSYFKSARQKR